MSDLFDPNPSLRDPQDGEAIRLGAGRLRTLKSILQTLLANIFVDASGSNFSTDALPSSLLKASQLGNGLSKANGSSPVQVNYDGITLNVDGSSPPKLQVRTFVSSLQVIGSPTDLTLAHGLGVIPSFIRAVYIPQATGNSQSASGTMDLGYSLLDEVDVLSSNMTVDQSGISNPFEGYQTSGGTVTFYGYRPCVSADATNVYLTIPNAHIFLTSKHNSAGTSPTFGVEIAKANWQLKVYARA